MRGREVSHVAAKRSSETEDFASLEQWLQWQESLHIKNISLGLERCRTLMQRLGLERPAKTVVSVAGTNGKGSSVAMLDSVLRQGDYSVGTYTSPHLLRYNERIKINGVAAPDELICTAFRRIESARDDIPLTYFEFGTLAALILFADAELDVAILEVGLGGRLDAVNIVDADVALITTIGIDHIEYLGNTREEIALEKAGIMRTGKPAVCSDANMPSTLKARASELPTKIDILGDSYLYADEGSTWTWWHDNTVLADLPKPNLPGTYQLANAAGVLRVVDILRPTLPISDSAIVDGLAAAHLPGRFQRIEAPVETIIDVAHNAQAAEAFVQTLQQLPPAHKTHVILGMLRVKDRESVIRHLSAVADSWHLASVAPRRGASSGELYESLQRVAGKRVSANQYDCVGDAYRSVLNLARSGDRIIALGSFLVVAQVLECLE